MIIVAILLIMEEKEVKNTPFVLKVLRVVGHFLKDLVSLLLQRRRTR